LGMAALAIDLSMLFKVRSDAQRAADAGALAGASAYIVYPDPLDARDTARGRAREYVGRNYVGDLIYVDTTGEVVTYEGDDLISVSNEALVQVLPHEEKVRVTVRRRATGTWFGRIFGIGSVPISAKAAAAAMRTGGAKCVKPFAIADLWQDIDNDIGPSGADRLWDTSGEEWEFNPEIDHYAPYAPPGSDLGEYTSPQTGYGSDFRNGYPTGSQIESDWGRQIVVKPQDPQVDQVIKPGNFFAWDMPLDSVAAADTCGVGGGTSGASGYSKYICACNNNVIRFDTTYAIENGNMKGPTKVGVQDLVNGDPGASWDPLANGGQGAVVGSRLGTEEDQWMESPRVIKIALYDPVEVYKSGKLEISFTNIAKMFIEDYQTGSGQVTARFLIYAQGAATPGPGGPLVKVIRLVE
jgi:hypothetical protein